MQYLVHLIATEALVYIKITLIYFHTILFVNNLICNITNMTRQTLLDFIRYLYWWLKYAPNINAYKILYAAAAPKLHQSCPTLCDPIDGNPLGSPVPGILQARILEWVAISFSNAWKWKVKLKSLSCVWLLVTPWTAAYQHPPSMGFSRQEYWSGLPLPSPKFLYKIILINIELLLNK